MMLNYKAISIAHSFHIMVMFLVLVLISQLKIVTDLVLGYCIYC